MDVGSHQKEVYALLDGIKNDSSAHDLEDLMRGVGATIYRMREEDHNRVDMRSVYNRLAERVDQSPTVGYKQSEKEILITNGCDQHENVIKAMRILHQLSEWGDVRTEYGIGSQADLCVKMEAIFET